MNKTVFSILLVIIGLVLGTLLTFLINKIRVNNAEKKIKSLSEKAQKEAEKVIQAIIIDSIESTTIIIMIYRYDLAKFFRFIFLFESPNE